MISKKADMETVECPKCDGAGKIVTFRTWGISFSDQEEYGVIHSCNECEGKGKVLRPRGE